MAVTARPGRPEQAHRAAARRTAPEPGSGRCARRHEPAVPGVPGAVPGPAGPRPRCRQLAAALQTTPAALLGAGANVPPGQCRPADLRVVSKLLPAECRRLIAPGGVGRIAFGDDLRPGRGAGQLRRGGRHARDQDGRGHGHRRARPRAGRVRGRSHRRGALPGLERAGARARRTASRTRPSWAACKRTPRSGRGPAASATSTCGSSPRDHRPPHRAAARPVIENASAPGPRDPARKRVTGVTGARPPVRPGRPAGRCNPTRCRTSRIP